MNENKKSAKRYHQSIITALKKKVNDMKDSAYSGLYSEIAFIIGIAVIMIDTFFPQEKTKVNGVCKVILILVSILCMLYFAKKVKTVNEVEAEKEFWPNFFIQWATGLGYINMPVAVIAILVTLNKDNVGTFVMIGIAIILTAFTFIEALVKTSKIVKMVVRENKID